MNTAEIEQLYAKIDNELENLGIGKSREYKHPEFTEAQLMAIPKIIDHLKNNKYKETIKVTTYPMRMVVIKIQPQAAEKPFFSPENLNNLNIEKSENEIQAEQAFNNCKSNNHVLVQSNQTTFGTPILICQQCKYGYTYKLNSGATKVKSIFKIL